jgi:hypothetical protein
VTPITAPGAAATKPGGQACCGRPGTDGQPSHTLGFDVVFTGDESYDYWPGSCGRPHERQRGVVGDLRPVPRCGVSESWDGFLCAHCGPRASHDELERCIELLHTKLTSRLATGQFDESRELAVRLLDLVRSRDGDGFLDSFLGV